MSRRQDVAAHAYLGAFPAADTLLIALEAAVPLWILELQHIRDRRVREQTRMKWAKDAAAAIAHKGDVLQYGSKKRGEAADAFNHLARGLAVGSFQPGGITFAGKHWETLEPEGFDPDEDPDLAWAEPAEKWYQRTIVDAVRSL